MNAIIEIMLIALVVSVATNLLRRKMISREDMLKMAESQLYKKSLLEARRKNDEKLLQKLLKKQEYYQKVDAQIAKKNIITLILTLIIFYVAYLALGQFYGSTNIIANLPGDLIIPLISIENKLTVSGWFIISLIALGLPISKILGVSPPEKPENLEKKIKE
ncbi:MAG: EMC3/TMCO1 family protein [Nitrososphaerota archaeon]|nr:EMC3/TMCO1 family protein [Candidatus Geocrenenecus dongiae]